MPLEETDVVDVITSGPEGRLSLIVIDAGLTEDPEERYALLAAKLRTYMGYCLDEGFADQHPGARLDRVAFRVICRIPPTPAMVAIVELTTRGPVPVRIPVSIEVQD
jgi:hypothetical protein